MTAPPRSREEELAALRRPFLVGAGLVAVAVVAIGLVVAAFGSGADRPAGVAERWLVAVGDTTRDGVEDDARHRVEELSADPSAMTTGIDTLGDLSASAVDEGKAVFEGVRVGAPLEGTTDAAVVPVELTPRDEDPVQLYVGLVDDPADGWRVVGLQAIGDDGSVFCTTECPGFPIERPARVGLGWFAGALLLGVVITLGCIAAVRAATPEAQAA